MISISTDGKLSVHAGERDNREEKECKKKCIYNRPVQIGDLQVVESKTFSRTAIYPEKKQSNEDLRKYKLWRSRNAN